MPDAGAAPLPALNLPARGLAVVAPSEHRWFDIVAIAAGLSLALMLQAATLAAVWRTGAYADPDDAMRLVEVRDWLAGQAWFDLTAHRLMPPDGVFMHWSRLMDVPIAALIRLFSAVAPVEAAERITRIVFPLACTAVLFAGVIALARSLIADAPPFAPVLIAATTGMLLMPFAPGTLDHHGVQICLLVFMVAASLRGLDATHPGDGAMAAGLAVLSLAISVENLPFIAVLAMVLGLAWLWTGQAFDQTLRNAGLALGGTAAMLYLATVGPARYGDASCDAFSAFHLMVLLCGGAGFALLGQFGHMFSGRLPRGGALVALGGIVLFAATRRNAACLGDPLAALDAFLRDNWLRDVREARPLLTILRETPDLAAPLLYAPLLGLAGIVAACAREGGIARRRWLGLLAFTLAGAMAAAWQVRALASVTPLALMGGVYVLQLAWRAARARLGPAMARPVSLAMVLPFSSLFWAIATPTAETDARLPQGEAQDCLANAAYAPLAGLGAASMLAPVDLGAHLLANTSIMPIAAPFHRDANGIRAALEFFLSEPAEAHAIALRARAHFVVTCPWLREVAIYAERAPHGMAAELAAGRAPDWLRRVAVGNTPLAVYRVD